MKSSLRFAAKALLSGFLAVVPIYLAVLLLLKGIQSVAKLMHPVILLVPDWLPAEGILSVLLVLVIHARGPDAGIRVVGCSPSVSRLPGCEAAVFAGAR